MILRRRRETTQTCSQSAAQALSIIRFGSEVEEEEDDDDEDDVDNDDDDCGDSDVMQMLTM